MLDNYCANAISLNLTCNNYGIKCKRERLLTRLLLFFDVQTQSQSPAVARRTFHPLTSSDAAVQLEPSAPPPPPSYEEASRWQSFNSTLQHQLSVPAAVTASPSCDIPPPLPPVTNRVPLSAVHQSNGILPYSTFIA